VSRTTHFGIGIAIAALCFFWVMLCRVMFLAVAFDVDAHGEGSVFDARFILLYLVGGSGFIGGIWCAFLCFRRALRPPRLEVPPPTCTPSVTPEQQQSLATPDERLAHLVKRTET
jgi:hypothetical protein